jgi:hypothetical protein
MEVGRRSREGQEQENNDGRHVGLDKKPSLMEVSRDEIDGLHQTLNADQVGNVHENSKNKILRWEGPPTYDLSLCRVRRRPLARRVHPGGLFSVDNTSEEWLCYATASVAILDRSMALTELAYHR